MDIFDRFLNADETQFSQKQSTEPWDERKRKEIGMKREKSAIRAIKELLYSPENFLHGLHFIEPTTGETCEVDGLYVARDVLVFVEIKSKNFDYMYGNFDTGYWYLEYGGKMVRSDNAFRQISRQMRIARADTGLDMGFIGIVFINNKNEDVRLDIVGKRPDHLFIETDARRIAKFLNSLPENGDRKILEHIRAISVRNEETGLHG